MSPPVLPEEKAKWLFVIRLRRSQLQRVALARKDDPSFNWRAWARAVVNESMFLPKTEYVCGKTVHWHAANAATAMCHGKNRLADLPSEVPAHIREQIELGAQDALARGGHMRVTGEDLGRAVGLTDELRRELKAWLLWPVDVSKDDCIRAAEERREARREARRQNPAEREKARRRDEAKRRREGSRPRAESIAAQARILGIKPNTLRTRLRRAALVGTESHVPFSFALEESSICDGAKENGTTTRSPTPERAASKRRSNRNQNQKSNIDSMILPSRNRGPKPWEIVGCSRSSFYRLAPEDREKIILSISAPSRSDASGVVGERASSARRSPLDLVLSLSSPVPKGLPTRMEDATRAQSARVLTTQTPEIRDAAIGIVLALIGSLNQSAAQEGLNG